MAFVPQVWTVYDFEPNPVGPNTAYDSATFLQHLKDWFGGLTAAAYDQSQWVISAQGTDWLELMPNQANAINPGDRLLIFGNGVAPAGANCMADPGFTPSANVNYICYAPGAGTTGPDNDPASVNAAPYIGVNSSKLLVGRGTIVSASQQALRIMMSTDGIFIHTKRNSGTVSIDDYQGFLLAGRLFEPVEPPEDVQLPLIYGMGDTCPTGWSESFNESGYFNNPLAAMDAGDPVGFVQLTDADVPFVICERSNCWRRSAFSGPGNRKFYDDILLNQRTFATAGGEHIGRVRCAKLGEQETNATIITDVTGNRGVAVSINDNEAIHSTFYLWNE